MKTKATKPMGTFMIAMFGLFAFHALGAEIDGKWKGETMVRERSVRATFDLKSDGGRLTGTVEFGTRKRAAAQEIKDGKVEGNKFSFSTVMQTKKKGEVKVHWDGTIAGNELKVTRNAAKGKKRSGAEMVMKRAEG